MENNFFEVIESYRRRLETHSSQCHRNSETSMLDSYHDNWNIQNGHHDNYPVNSYVNGGNNWQQTNGLDSFGYMQHNASASTIEPSLPNRAFQPLKPPRPPSGLDLGMNLMTCSQNGHDLDLYAQEMYNLEQRRMVDCVNGFQPFHSSWLQGQNVRHPGDVYPEDSNSVRLTKVATSPLVERRNIRRLPRPITSPAEIQNLSTLSAEQFPGLGLPLRNRNVSPKVQRVSSLDMQQPTRKHDSSDSSPESCYTRKCLDTQSLTSSPAPSRKNAKPPILQRYNSLSPTLIRKKIADKLSPASLRKSVILRSSRNSEPIYVDMCGGCGFPLRDENRVSVATRGGKRKEFHGECFKCSV